MNFKKWCVLILCLGVCLQLNNGSAGGPEEGEQDGHYTYTSLSEKRPSRVLSLIKKTAGLGLSIATVYFAAYQGARAGSEFPNQDQREPLPLISIPEDSSYQFPVFENVTFPEDDDLLDSFMSNCSIDSANHKWSGYETPQETTIRLLGFVFWDFYQHIRGPLLNAAATNLTTLYCACVRGVFAEGDNRNQTGPACSTFLRFAVNATRPSSQTDIYLMDEEGSHSQGSGSFWDYLLDLS